MKKRVIYFPERQWGELGRLAKQLGLSKSELIRRTVDEMLEKHPRVVEPGLRVESTANELK